MIKEDKSGDTNKVDMTLPEVDSLHSQESRELQNEAEGRKPLEDKG